MEWKELQAKMHETLGPHEVMKMNLIKDITLKRYELNWSQRELAKQAGVPQTVIARMEKNVVAPRLDTLVKICVALGLNIITDRKVQEQK